MLSVVRGPKPVLPPAFPVSPLDAAGCRMDSKAKKRPAIGAPKPAEMPAADPAAIKPRRRDGAFWDAVEEGEAEEEEEAEEEAPAVAPAMAAPISTEGPSGPSEAPEPSVTTAAAAFRKGLMAGLRVALRAVGSYIPHSFTSSSVPALPSPLLATPTPLSPPPLTISQPSPMLQSLLQSTPSSTPLPLLLPSSEGRLPAKGALHFGASSPSNPPPRVPTLASPPLFSAYSGYTTA